MKHTKEQAYERAVREIAQYETAIHLRKENQSLYLFLRRWELLYLMPKGDHITKLAYTDEELLLMADKYETLYDIRTEYPNLLRALKKRKILPERFEWPRPKAEKQKRGRPKKEKAEKVLTPKQECIDIIPEAFRPGKRRGPHACFRATKTDTGTICGRCRKEFQTMSKPCNDLCHSCYNAKVLWDNYNSTKEDNPCVLNLLGNVKDRYCHIILQLPDGPMYVGIELNEQEKRKIITSGYSFILK